MNVVRVPVLAHSESLRTPQFPPWLSVVRVVRRTIRGFGRIRPDMPEGCPERFEFAFLRFVWTYNRERRARNLALVESFGGRRIVLHGGGAVRRFMDE